MYNIILALVLTCSLGGIVFLLSRKRKMVEVESETKEEKESLQNNSTINSLSPKVVGLLSTLKVKREVVENITEKGLRRLRVFVLRVDNQLVDSIGKLKEDKTTSFVDNGKVQALIDAHAADIATETQVIMQEETTVGDITTNIWSLEQNYLDSLNNHFDKDVFSKLTNLYLDLGDLSTLRGTLLKAVNSDLSWDDIISEPRFIDSFKKIAQDNSFNLSKTRSIKRSMSPKIHQRKNKVSIEI
jgi:hypothetical protein